VLLLDNGHVCIASDDWGTKNWCTNDP
jgi:hypothetical protein